MSNSKEWNWEAAKDEMWLTPCEESYYYSEKWKNEARSSLLDLGCGLGRHSVFFAKQGFKVSATDLSDYGINHLKNWLIAENVDALVKKADMLQLPFSDGEFDCIWAYHVISHTDSVGIQNVFKEIRRVLKPKGAIYLTLCAKDSPSFSLAKRKIDDNTIIKDEPPEKDIPHFYVNINDINRLLIEFKIIKIRHIDDYYVHDTDRLNRSSHFFIEAVLEKDTVE